MIVAPHLMEIISDTVVELERKCVGEDNCVTSLITIGSSH